MDATELWATKYAQLHAEERAKEEARREQAFLDLPAKVCGEELRIMTAMDLLVLTGVDNAFVCGFDPRPGDVLVFLWFLSTDNNNPFGRPQSRLDAWANERRHKKLARRFAERVKISHSASQLFVSTPAFEADCKAIKEYVDEVFQDSRQGAGGEGRRPLGACFLAPLVVNLAEDTGWSEDAILSTPLPRLFQYLKAIRAKKEGKEFTDWAPSDRVTGQFLAELNHVNNPSSGLN